jgi:hypothetical protein
MNGIMRPPTSAQRAPSTPSEKLLAGILIQQNGNSQVVHSKSG